MTEQQVERALREGEVKYRTLFETASDAILLMREDCFVDCNARASALFGCARDEIIGAPPYQFSPPRQPLQIKEDPRTRAMPVVILTSSTEERDLITSYHLGANSYIQKPVEFSQFQETVKQLGLYWLVVNQPPPAVRAAEA